MPTASLLKKDTAPRSWSGQTGVEFVLVLSMFALLLCALLDFSRMFFVQVRLQDAVDQAGRFASTGNHLANPNQPGNNLTRIQSIIDVAQQAAGPGTDISNIQISSLQGGKGSPGGPGDTVTIALTTNLKLITPIVAQFFPNGNYSFTSSTTFKNEPFPSSQTN